MGVRFSELCVDCSDPHALADFWSKVLDYKITETDEDSVEISGPEGSGPTLLFITVPEHKQVKNRLHIDVSPIGADQDAEVERILGLGARKIDIGQGDVSWVVMADPEGNEFCVLSSRID